MIKKLVFLIVFVSVPSCSVINEAVSHFDEDELIITRKFVGIYMSYRHTGPDNYEGPNLIWIKTTMESTYGKISAYGKTCDFSLGERLYLRRAYFNPAFASGYWVYFIENDSGLSYKATDFQHDRKYYLRTRFE
mgnify:CR=1 FL=1